MPGIARHEHVLDADLGRDLGREERPAAALGDEHELARVEALAHRGLLDRVDHRVHEDAVDAHRGLLDRGAELAREVRVDRLAREILAQAHLAAQEELRAQPAEHDHRVGGGRLGAAAVVGDRARVGARRARPDAEDAARVDVGDRAAAGADRVDVDHRDHRLVRADLRVEQVLHAQLAVLREADVGRGAADVERDHVAARRDCRPVQMPPTTPAIGPDMSRLTGFSIAPCGRRDAGRRGHQVDARPDVHRAQRGVEAADVARDLGADVGVQADGREALVLAVLRDDLARDREERLGELLAHDRRDALLVLGVQEREQQAHGDGLDLLGLEAAHLRAHLVVVERDEDRCRPCRCARRRSAGSGAARSGTPATAGSARARSSSASCAARCAGCRGSPWS